MKKELSFNGPFIRLISRCLFPSGVLRGVYSFLMGLFHWQQWVWKGWGAWVCCLEKKKYLVSGPLPGLGEWKGGENIADIHGLMGNFTCFVSSTMLSQISKPGLFATSSARLAAAFSARLCLTHAFLPLSSPAEPCRWSSRSPGAGKVPDGPEYFKRCRSSPCTSPAPTPQALCTSASISARAGATRQGCSIFRQFCLYFTVTFLKPQVSPNRPWKQQRFGDLVKWLWGGD